MGSKKDKIAKKPQTSDIWGFFNFLNIIFKSEYGAQEGLTFFIVSTNFKGFDWFQFYMLPP